ncbi:MAG: hypothetical protein QOE77_1681 [Blastocatellia bacterium]|jgi:hypothetical protein|nr:hypothetical protein [Blastocatellia bacterium]
MDLVRDCLDEHLVDRNKRPMGRVDGIILEVGTTGPPRVAYIELGSTTVADRLSPRLSSLMSRMLRRKSSDRYRIPWNKLRVGLNELTADVEAEATPALAWELWLRKKVIGRIPGA